MTHTAAIAPDITDLVDRLTKHKTLGAAPRSELEWLARHGELRHYDAGGIVIAKGDPVNDMVVMLSGHVTTSVERGSGRRHLLDSYGGEVTALLPFSRLSASLGDVKVVEPTDILNLRRDQFPELIRECPAIIEIVVHTMLDRARALASTNWQDDKMASLGRLAAGLAHELNNPASAAARSAKRLTEALGEVHEVWQALVMASLTDAQRELITSFATRSLLSTSTGLYSAIERADQEEEIVEWLEAHGANPAPAAILSESGLTPDALEELVESLPTSALDIALRWIAAEYTTRTLAAEVERATTRIHDLVSAVKRFTYMNRAATAEPTNIGQGLADTVAVLASKARAKSVAIRFDVAPDLPTVVGNPGELNQVWANLIENALDAVSENGHITVSASRDGHDVTVCVIDDGPGIPAEIENRIFDPFFTTKPIGQGTGLGLDISRRIVQGHEGAIAVQSRPGRTEFRVTLPIDRKRV